MKTGEAEKKTKESEIYDDVWIPTQCRRCSSSCGILAHRVDRVVVRLEGNPNTSSGSKGGMVVRVGGKLIDGSTRNKLASLKKALDFYRSRGRDLNPCAASLQPAA